MALHLRLFLLFSVTLNFAIGQGTETFTNVPAGTPNASSYFICNWTGDNGLAWTSTAAESRTDQTITGKAIALRVGGISSSSISGGIGTISFKYKYLFTDGGNALIQIKVNDVVKAEVIVAPTQTTTQSSGNLTINVPGTFKLEIAQVNPRVSGGPRVAIDDVVWTGFTAGPCVSPTTQAGTPVFSAVAPTTLTLTWPHASPLPNRYLVTMGANQTIASLPQNGTSYEVDDVIGNGTVVYKGTSNTVALQDLLPGTNYCFYVFALNDECNGGPLYNTSNPPTACQATSVPLSCVVPAALPTALSFTAVANTTINGSFTAASDAEAYLVCISNSNALNFTPTNATTYTNGQTVGSGKVIKAGSGNTFSATGLVAGTTYYISVFGYNGLTCTGGNLYNTTALQGSTATTSGADNGIPAGYYSTITNQTCATLKTALKTITTTGHNQKGYSSLWSQYMSTDIKPREVGSGSANVIWDIYSDNPNGTDPYNFTPGSSQCGSYNSEADCYNREHSVPQGWFTGGTDIGPGTDYNHIFPTDGQVNAARGSYIFGEVTNPTFTSQNGSKVGPNAFAGLSDIAFEPINAYKGDLARAFFYFVTRYQDNMPSWGGGGYGYQAFDPTTFPSIDVPYLKLMLKWHQQDPVSQKEIDRNNGTYSYQNNRNPFIDHPEYVDRVWNANCGLALPVSLISFTGTQHSSSIVLKWQVADETNFSRYEIERSVNGTSFTKVGEVAGKGATFYDFTDAIQLLSGRRLYYRLAMVDKDGSRRYSEVFTVHTALQKGIAVFPNPVRNGSFTIQSAEPLEKSTLKLCNASGQTFHTQIIAAGSQTIHLQLKGIENGSYLIQVISQHSNTIVASKRIVVMQ